MQISRTFAAITAALMLAIPPVASTRAATTDTLRAGEIAAGYEALFLCSDLFVGNMSEAAIDDTDLTGWRFPLDAVHATVDRETRSVSVRFDADAPPRIAVWRPLLGCAHLPTGAGPDVADALPRLPRDLAPPSLDHADWPRGDAHAIAPLPAVKKTALDALVARAFDATSYGENSKTSSVLVLLDGRIVAERYDLGVTMHTPQRTWSMAKSLAATLVGRAVELGHVEVSMPANIPQWQHPGDPRAAITLDQLLRMNSGLWTDGPGNRTDSLYWGGSTVPETAAAAPLEAMPGSRFNYANNDFLLATYSVMNTLGPDALAFPFKEVLWPLGMTRTTPETDWQGHYVMSSQVWMTARDSARLALLYAGGGTFDGQRLLPEGWTAYVSSASGAQPKNPRAQRYGAGFWVLDARQGLPSGTYAMEGSRGQYAVIVPSANVIVVRRGFDALDARFDINRFTRDALDVLQGGGGRQ